MNYLDIIYTLYAAQPEGYSTAALEQAEARIGYTLTAVLKHYYQRIGLNEMVNAAFNRLLTPAQLGFSDNGYLVFYEENQAVVVWGIKKEDLTQDNPPVYGSYDHGETWLLDADNLEKFLLNMAYTNAALGALPHAAATEQIPGNIVEQVEKKWTEQKDLSYQFVRFFTRDYRQIIAMTINQEQQVAGLYVGASDEVLFREVMEQLKVDWDYRSDLHE